ncbi:MAG: DsbA family protein, partial [Candidatus Micrarchaeota archaeon]|nr:DsbA family protein [Candidatus Micrarchaeota archaeon]
VMFGNYTFDLTGLEPRGNPDAPITIIEYSDFQCPFCSKVQPTIEQILKDYDGKVKIYYEQFPLTQIHPNAQKAAEASLLAAEQGKFWEYHDILFKNQDKLDVKYLKEYASQLGLDAEKFNYGLDSGIKAQTVNKNLQEGIKNGVQGTPTFFINGHILTGAQPYSVFKQIIDSELNRLEQ